VKHPFLNAEFLTTAADWHQLPVDGAPEVAFAGRSNAGKSSAINALAQRTRLAFVSKTPGRTQNINFFRLRSGALLADLPGYGYAEVPAAMRRHWQHFIARYLAERVPLTGLVLVMDARRAMTDLDRQMLDWFLPSLRPTHILLTKADKFTVAEQRRSTAQRAPAGRGRFSPTARVRQFGRFTDSQRSNLSRPRVRSGETAAPPRGRRPATECSRSLRGSDDCARGCQGTIAGRVTRLRAGWG